MEHTDIIMLKDVAGALNNIAVAGRTNMTLMVNCINILDKLAAKYGEKGEKILRCAQDDIGKGNQADTGKGSQDDTGKRAQGEQKGARFSDELPPENGKEEK